MTDITQIITALMEKYDWAVKLYIIGQIVLYAVAFVAIGFIVYYTVKSVKKSNVEYEKMCKEHEEHKKEIRERINKSRREFSSDDDWKKF